MMTYNSRTGLMDSADVTTPEEKSRRPIVHPFTQQRLKDLKPNVNINSLLVIYFAASILFISTGCVFNSNSRSDINEYSIKYDGSGTNYPSCSISQSNTAQSCQVDIKFESDISGPLFIYYEVENFYQNHRRYVRSRSPYQLMGQNLAYSEVESDCYPLIKNGSLLLNPCGLVANTFFNDIISLSNSSLAAGYELDTDGIAWFYDKYKKFKQVDGFVSAKAEHKSSRCAAVLGSERYADCKSYTDPSTGILYFYWYPNDDNVQYLHETYSGIISPLEGVENEHFINWMRTAGLPNFRKLYGKIDSDFIQGDTLSFNLTLNFEVASYSGSKSLIVTTLGYNGSKSEALGNAYIIIGVLSLVAGCVLFAKRLLFPRPLGDIKALEWVQK